MNSDLDHKSGQPDDAAGSKSVRENRTTTAGRWLGLRPPARDVGRGGCHPPSWKATSATRPHTSRWSFTPLLRDGDDYDGDNVKWMVSGLSGGSFVNGSCATLKTWWRCAKVESNACIEADIPTPKVEIWYYLLLLPWWIIGQIRMQQYSPTKNLSKNQKDLR